MGQKMTTELFEPFFGTQPRQKTGTDFLVFGFYVFKAEIGYRNF